MDLVQMSDYDPLPSGANQYPFEFIEHNRAVKLLSADGQVVVGLANGATSGLLQTLRGFHNVPVRFVAIEPVELSGYLGRALSGAVDGEPVPAAPSAVLGTGGVSSHAPAPEERDRLDRLAHDAPIINLVNGLLIDGIRRRASDIHIEAFSDAVHVRYRIDGLLQTSTRVSREAFAGISSRVKVMANLNIMERRLPQDGRITVNLLCRTFDIRVSIVPIADGESVVLRLFDRSNGGLTLVELGFRDSHLRTVRGLLRLPHGLLLVTGPTGSGKTTTLTALVRELAGDARKVITIEDPVEYRVAGVDQIQSNEEIGLNFASLLGRVLRQDPDIIMVGEIRDSETAALAVRAALTGHLVLASLHTNDAVSSVPRLTDMGVKPYLVAGVLRGVIAQRLVRTVCDECGAARALTSAEHLLWERAAGEEGASGLASAPTFVPDAVGCRTCRSTGYRGRTAVAEVFSVDGVLERLIAQGAEAAVISAHLKALGFRPLPVEGLAKVADGATTIREVQRIGPV